MALNLLDTFLKKLREDSLRLLEAAKGGDVPLPLALDPFVTMAALSAPMTAILTAKNAGETLPFFNSTTWAFGWLFSAGPKEDGVTANVGPIFLGGEHVTAATGVRFSAGGGTSSGLGNILVYDLSKLSVHFLNAGDAARILYWG